MRTYGSEQTQIQTQSPFYLNYTQLKFKHCILHSCDALHWRNTQLYSKLLLWEFVLQHVSPRPDFAVMQHKHTHKVKTLQVDTVTAGKTI